MCVLMHLQLLLGTTLQRIEAIVWSIFYFALLFAILLGVVYIKYKKGVMDKSIFVYFVSWCNVWVHGLRKNPVPVLAYCQNDSIISSIPVKYSNVLDSPLAISFTASSLVPAPEHLGSGTQKRPAFLLPTKVIYILGSSL